MSIPESRRDWIRRLWAEGFSQRVIARLTHSARNTVARALAGEADEARRREREAREELLRAPAEKCPGCGRVVKMPCPLCLARNYLELNRQGGQRPREAPLDRRPPPGLQLREQHRARYQEIHDQKVQRGYVPWR